mmetsp:Transcript_129142/g.373836  ORF Transcript_129142/g.373836 Transcript_129142/m.373836 type:complete len:240 (-) Transcript_129142:248-967(-)
MAAASVPAASKAWARAPASASILRWRRPPAGALTWSAGRLWPSRTEAPSEAAALTRWRRKCAPERLGGGRTACSVRSAVPRWATAWALSAYAPSAGVGAPPSADCPRRGPLHSGAPVSHDAAGRELAALVRLPTRRCGTFLFRRLDQAQLPTCYHRPCPSGRMLQSLRGPCWCPVAGSSCCPAARAWLRAAGLCCGIGSVTMWRRRCSLTGSRSCTGRRLGSWWGARGPSCCARHHPRE